MTDVPAPAPRTILALIGPKASGKTTLAAQLVAERNLLHLSFAAPIKHMVRTLLQIQSSDHQKIEEMLFGQLKETSTELLAGRTPRYAMQTLGTEWRDLISQDLWTNIWKRAVETNSERSIVVDDMRFLHEAEAIRSLGGHILRIHREGQLPSTDPHISEHEWPKIDYDCAIINYPDRQTEMLQQVIAFLEQK